MAAGPRGEGFIRRAISLSQVRLQSALQRQLPLPDTPSLLKNIFFPLVFGCSKTVWAVSCAAKGCCCLWEEKNPGGSTRGQKSVPYHGVHTALCCPRPQILIQKPGCRFISGSVEPVLAQIPPGCLLSGVSLILLHGYGHLIILSDYFFNSWLVAEERPQIFL